MISSIISRLVILVFGTLYPAYASYKAVRTKNLKEYVKWMMYWIVFALFTCTETFTDVFLSWFPFYYEVKIVIVLWLLSPATKGSSILYRKFVHPALCRREQEIDEYIAKAKDQGYHTVLNLGTKGVNYATTVIMQTAIKGGGGLVQQLRKSYSLSDLAEVDCDPRSTDEADDVMTPQVMRRTHDRSGYNTRRSASESSRSMYFPEVDVEVRNGRASRGETDFSHIKSSEDISSGYSSADNSNAALSRTGSVGPRTRSKLARTTITSVKRPQAAEDSEVIIEELHEDDSFDYATMPPLLNMSSPLYLSHTKPPFIYQYVGDQVKIIQVLGNPATTGEVSTESLKRQNATTPSTLTTDSNTDLADFKEIKDTVLRNENTVDTQTKMTTEESNLKLIDNQLSSDTSCSKNDAYNIQSKGIVIKEDFKLYQNRMTDRDTSSLDEYAISNIVSTPNINIEVEKNTSENVKDTDTDVIESTSLETSLNENDSGDSDDEASFGTPDDSPKTKRKSPRGRYGKGKAPPPPIVEPATEIDNYLDDSNIDVPQQSKMLETITKGSSPARLLQVVNPIAEKKRRHKSKSPNKTRSNKSAIGKLLQLPGKIAFWNNKNEKSPNISSVSDDYSRKSSTELSDVVESFTDVNVLVTISNEKPSSEAAVAEFIEKSDDQISFKDASDFDNESIAHDVFEKSDELQKLIDAKIESHPEYKFISLSGDDDVSTSKSTDV